MLRFSKWPLSFRFPHQNRVRIFLLNVCWIQKYYITNKLKLKCVFIVEKLIVVQLVKDTTSFMEAGKIKVAIYETYHSTALV
jgi:hypothetical protein